MLTYEAVIYHSGGYVSPLGCASGDVKMGAGWGNRPAPAAMRRRMYRYAGIAAPRRNGGLRAWRRGYLAMTASGRLQAGPGSTHASTVSLFYPVVGAGNFNNWAGRDSMRHKRAVLLSARGADGGAIPPQSTMATGVRRRRRDRYGGAQGVQLSRLPLR
jgi:hypothetical protein